MFFNDDRSDFSVELADGEDNRYTGVNSVPNELLHKNIPPLLNFNLLLLLDRSPPIGFNIKGIEDGKTLVSMCFPCHTNKDLNYKKTVYFLANQLL